MNSKYTETDKFKVARLAIEIAKKGGFEKVTWDGAEDGKVPSDPITDTLGMLRDIMEPITYKTSHCETSTEDGVKLISMD